MQFFGRGARERLRAICDDLDEWRMQGRLRCECAITPGPCAPARAAVVREFSPPNPAFVPALVLPRPVPRRPYFPSRVPYAEVDTNCPNYVRLNTETYHTTFTPFPRPVLD